MDKSNVVIAGYTVSKSWEFLLDSNDFDSLRERVTNVPELVVSGVVWHKQAFFVPSCGPADYTRATNSGLDDWDEWAKLWLENTVKVVGASGCD